MSRLFAIDRPKFPIDIIARTIRNSPTSKGTSCWPFRGIVDAAERERERRDKDALKETTKSLDETRVRTRAMKTSM
jgi:hypothetical protein